MSSVTYRRWTRGNGDAAAASSRWDLCDDLRCIRVQLLELAVELVVAVLRDALEDVPATQQHGGDEHSTVTLQPLALRCSGVALSL
eukprot:COSAG03_NODE_17406_length_376_cov_0.920578_2_plen_85_part_01